jgi:hypothetical protein
LQSLGVAFLVNRLPVSNAMQANFFPVWLDTFLILNLKGGKSFSYKPRDLSPGSVTNKLLCTALEKFESPASGRFNLLQNNRVYSLPPLTPPLP